MISEALYRRFYGDPRGPQYDGTLLFYTSVRELARPDSRVLNLGAGPASGNPVKSLKGEVAQLVGADIDPVVLQNSELDAAVVIEGGRLPFADESFDLAFSDYVLEHVERPAPFLAEVYRVLKPGRRYLFRTPNLYHYVALASRATPHWFHQLVANRARGLAADAHQPWPTFYRLNSRRAIRDQARAAGFAQADLRMIEYQPSYLMFHAVPFLAGVAYERAVNSTDLLAGLRANIFGQLTK
jgi:SAM-dependent methyltransferase